MNALTSKFFLKNSLEIVFTCKNEKTLIKTVCSTEAVSRRCSAKKVLLRISQNSQKNTYARASFLIKLQEVIEVKRLIILLIQPGINLLTWCFCHQL